MSFLNLKLKLEQFPVLSSERLAFVPLVQTDLAALLELRSDPAVMKYIDRPPIKTVEEVSAFIDKIKDGVNRGEWLYWKIQLKGTSELLGTCCLWLFNEDGLSCDIGYELRKKAWGNGYMSEAIEVISRYGFEYLGLKKIVALTARENEASLRLLQKSGFILDSHNGNDSIYVLSNFK